MLKHRIVANRPSFPVGPFTQPACNSLFGQPGTVDRRVAGQGDKLTHRNRWRPKHPASKPSSRSLAPLALLNGRKTRGPGDTGPGNAGWLPTPGASTERVRAPADRSPNAPVPAVPVTGFFVRQNTCRFFRQIRPGALIQEYPDQQGFGQRGPSQTCFRVPSGRRRRRRRPGRRFLPSSRQPPRSRTHPNIAACINAPTSTSRPWAGNRCATQSAAVGINALSYCRPLRGSGRSGRCGYRRTTRRARGWQRLPGGRTGPVQFRRRLCRR